MKYIFRSIKYLNYRQYEEAISSYDGADPLSPWYEYICWIEQSYPKGGTVLNDAISKCLVLFEKESRYKQDRRLIKLFIKYVIIISIIVNMIIVNLFISTD